MYLRRRVYVNKYSDTSIERLEWDILKSLIDPSKIEYIEEEVCYWRKANMIHKRFVENVQEGRDDAGDYEVSREQLQQLLGIVSQVLTDHSKAEELLPTCSWFFFGWTEYDEHYFQAMEHTKKELEKILKFPNDRGSYFYHSSW